MAGATAETISVRALVEADVLSGQPLNGWYIHASVEQCRFLSLHRLTTDSLSFRFSSLEVTALGGHETPDDPPFSDGDLIESVLVGPGPLPHRR